MTRFILSALALAGLASPALAHAQLTMATPAVDAVIATSPTELDLTFSEALTLAFTGASLDGPGPARHPTAQAFLAPGNEKTLVVPLPTPLSPGTYTVSWHSLSQDGHKSHGTYRFTLEP